MLDHKIDLAIAWYASGNTSRYSLLIILDVFFKEFREDSSHRVRMAVGELSAQR